MFVFLLQGRWIKLCQRCFSSLSDMKRFWDCMKSFNCFVSTFRWWLVEVFQWLYNHLPHQSWLFSGVQHIDKTFWTGDLWICHHQQIGSTYDRFECLAKRELFFCIVWCVCVQRRSVSTELVQFELMSLCVCSQSGVFKIIEIKVEIARFIELSEALSL